jgi:glucose-6-phosphate 1-dehydrogenase
MSLSLLQHLIIGAQRLLICQRILDAYVSKHLNQNQILRIDHYTGKEALLDLEKVARFGIFKYMLSSKTISKIEIRFHEKKTIENRGMFYEETGALRDVGQNHVLYMLSHVLTLPFLHESIESASAIRAKQLDSIVSNPKASLYQYDTYTNESHVKKNSNTETFFVFEGIVKNTVWNNTKVVLSGGKGLKEDDVAIYIYFRKNKEPLRIPVGTYGERGAYIHVLLAALSWNVDMFPDFKQIETSWNIIEKIKKNSKLKGTYKKGTTPLV